MKKKKILAKLTLNKETIANLRNGTMSGIKGGEDTMESCYEPTYCWGCPTLICPDLKTQEGCPGVPPNTEYDTCLYQSCMCTAFTDSPCFYNHTCRDTGC